MSLIGAIIITAILLVVMFMIMETREMLHGMVVVTVTVSCWIACNIGMLLRQRKLIK